MKRRQLLGTTATVGAAVIGAHAIPHKAWAASSLSRSNALPIPPVMVVNNQAHGELTAIESSHAFSGERQSPTLGYNQSYLGPTIRVRRGETTRLKVTNKTKNAITTHWHGLHVEGEVDGGPHSDIAPGQTWAPALRVDQPAATLWYHSHIHGQTAKQVYSGLAGLMIVDDPRAPSTGLPETYGLDDIPLIVQDRAFLADGTLYYSNRGPALMHGFRASEIAVNGAIRPQAQVPAGLVRLRILNGSNARIYTFSFEDDRTFHQVASEAGLLATPIAMRSIQLAPAERAEIVVNFTNGQAVRLLSTGDTNSPMGGMMSRGMLHELGGSPAAVTSDGRFEIMRFGVDASKFSSVTELPKWIAGAPLLPDWGKPVRRRDFSLDMGMGMMGRGRGAMMGRGMGKMMAMGINGKPMAMDRIDLTARVNEPEIWRVVSSQMAHSFHVHGTSFQVLSINGQPQPFEQTGMKDVVLVDGEVELLIRFTRKASKEFPFMYHCHLLEHEDAGMMGQFTVQ